MSSTSSFELMVAFSVGVSLPVLYLVAQWMRQSYRKACHSYRDLHSLLAVNAVMSTIQTGLSFFGLAISSDVASGDRFRANLLRDSVREIANLLEERIPRVPRVVVPGFGGPDAAGVR